MPGFATIVFCLGIIAIKIYALKKYLDHKNKQEIFEQIDESKVLQIGNIEKVCWTRFLDMSSKGKSQLQWDVIVIQAKPEKAKTIFQHRFFIDPCGVSFKNDIGMEDYVITTHETLEEALDGLEGLSNMAIFERHITHRDLHGPINFNDINNYLLRGL